MTATTTTARPLLLGACALALLVGLPSMAAVAADREGEREADGDPVAREALSVAPAPAATAPDAAPAEKSIEAQVPRSVTLSLGRDHAFGSVRSHVLPADLGKESWADWDRDGDGSLTGNEVNTLLSSLRSRETSYLSLSVGESVLAMGRMTVRLDGAQKGATELPLTGAVDLRIEGRMGLELPPGEHGFTLYDRPDHVDGVVPIRLSVVTGFQFVTVEGCRAELKGGRRRLEAVATRFAPACWGTVRRLAETR